MKKTLPSLLLGALLLSALPTLSVHAATPDAIGLTINNKIVHFETMPLQQNGRVLVPLRAISEAIGATVEWDAKTQTATITRDHDKIAMTLGSTTAHKNDQAVTLDVPPQLIDDATMIPVRFLIEGLGLQAKWDETTKTVSIDTRPAISQPLPPVTNQSALSIKEIAKNFDRVVMINIYDEDGKLLGSGSGMVVSADGKILTNHHVLAEATTAKVVFQDQTTFTASKVLLDDPDRDLALMQINVSNLTTVQFGNSDQLELGDNVVAIGSPLGMQNTLSAGLVSGLHRKIPVSKTKEVEFLQTNAPYTFGSSGGALFNMYGNVIGVTSQSAAYVGGELNFAIPSNDVTRFLEQPVTPMSFPEYEEYVAEQKQKAKEELLKEHPVPEDDEDAAYEAKYQKAMEINAKLKKDHSDITAPGSDQKLDVSYTTYPASDGYSQDIGITVYNYNAVDAQGNLNRDALKSLLLQFTRYAHDAGAVNPLVRLRMNFDAPDFSNQILSTSQHYDPRTGKVHVSGFQAGWAMLEDATGTITYTLNPDFDHTKQFAGLND
ncbi:stalk domain-containing protein [Tumebacillus permanentifrigoris]|uniref:Trypsin-like peptidase n=1 Tax=Tumebacillus permanentifrigoris TaxID=378543 RepID=A0A316DT40_9BACL|nr:stalk domain-containing protein [Tumebacillus permanentifrigoris]PWK09699.1 trypsin-like peptidase [Tumebacillus permanentifrigoris]